MACMRPGFSGCMASLPHRHVCCNITGSYDSPVVASSLPSSSSSSSRLADADADADAEADDNEPPDAAAMPGWCVAWAAGGRENCAGEECACTSILAEADDEVTGETAADMDEGPPAAEGGDSACNAR